MMSFLCINTHTHTHTHTYYDSSPCNVETMNQQDSQCTYNVTLRCVRATIVDRKAIVITYSGHVFVALGIQRACAILSPVACPVLQYFSTLSHKRHDFRRKFLQPDMCVSILRSNLSETFLIIRTTEREILS